MIWHSESTDAVMQELGTDREHGLSHEEASARLQIYGNNIVDKPRDLSFGHCLLSLLRRPSVWLLLIAAILSLALAIHQTITTYFPGDWITPTAVAVIALLRCTLVALRAWRAERALPSMKVLASPLVRVRRGGAEATVSAATLVPGDIVELSAGELVPADCRLLECFELHCDESSLSGDPLPVGKNAAADVRSVTPLPQRYNMLYAGCAVVRGRALAVVTATASATEAGRLALLRETEKGDALPMQATAERVGTVLSAPVLACGIAVAVVALLSNVGVLAALLLGFATAVALLPEEIPTQAAAVVTAAVRKLAKYGAVVSRTAVTEDLGRSAVVCTNKTGSFTQNRMTLVRAFTNGRMVKLDKNRPPEDLHTLLQMAALCSGRVPSATEQAVLDYARMHGTDLNDLAASFPRLGEIPFDPHRRRMTVVHLVDGRNLVISMGAPEDLLPLCGELPEDVANAEEFMGAEALRVLAVAYRTVAEAPTECFAEELERDLTFLGLLGLSDPMHEDVPETVATCARAGVRIVLFTNESLLTATASARRAGILKDRSEAIDGRALCDMPDDELAAVAKRCTVFSRISAEDKRRLVAVWQERNLPVLVSGEDAQDVPAMREAHVSCGMARSGAEIATSTSDMVLTDDRFSTLIRTVQEGRTAFLNLRKTVVLRVAQMTSLFLAVLASLLLFGGATFSPAALLWVGGVSSALFTFAMAREVPQWDTMRQPPRTKWERLLARGVVSLTAFGVLLAALALIAYHVLHVSAAFAVLALGQIVLFIAARSSLPMPLTRLFRAPWAWVALIGAAALFVLPLTVPVCAAVVGISTLEGEAWGTVGLLLGILFGVTELYKWVRFLLARAMQSKGAND